MTVQEGPPLELEEPHPMVHKRTTKIETKQINILSLRERIKPIPSTPLMPVLSGVEGTGLREVEGVRVG
jgi:hypothetical protein